MQSMLVGFCVSDAYYLLYQAILSALTFPVDRDNISDEIYQNIATHSRPAKHRLQCRVTNMTALEENVKNVGVTG